jgi:hypothetical protein
LSYHLHVLPQAAGFEQRLADLETQIDRLNLSLVRWRETEEQRQPAERRLAQVTDQCADLLKQWTATSERHAQVVGELEMRLTSWNDIETRLQHETSARFQGLERSIEREWAALRRLHEEPARELREQAETLTKISLNAAGSAQTGIERAEARLATLESDLHRRISDLSRDIHAVLSELRQHGGPALRNPANAWPLDEVTRLHHALRDGAGAIENPPVVDTSAGSSTTLMPRTPAAPLSGSTTQGVPQGYFEPGGAGDRAARVEDSPAARSVWRKYAAIAGLAVAIGLVAVALASSSSSRATLAEQRASEAQKSAERIATAAAEQIESARKDAALQITQAREAASKAQVATDVLAAPDLIRFNLTGGDSVARTSAQLLWSRSRGMVFSASRLAAPPPGSTYQIWLLTAGDPVSAGTVAPDPSGRVTLATDTPPAVPRPVLNVQVTVEPGTGSRAPSTAPVLSRAQ